MESLKKLYHPLKKADGLVVGSALCKGISDSLKKRQNPVIKLNKMVKTKIENHMNWITKFIKPKIKSLFKKQGSDNKETLWINCECKKLIYKDELFNNLSVCPSCGFHHKLTCEERFKIFLIIKSFKF